MKYLIKQGEGLKQMQKKYRINYLPIFEVDLQKTIDYISLQLRNPLAAEEFLSEIERAILVRAKAPLAFEKYAARNYHKNPYYRIYIKNYIIYYIVKEDVLEVRRLLYAKRMTDKHL